MKLQNYKGSGKRSHQTLYRVQPYLPNGKRTTIRLGTGVKNAQKAAQAIGDLIDSQKAGVDPNPETKGWLENSASSQICQQLLKKSLIGKLPERLTESSEREQYSIRMLVSEYIRTRCVGQAHTTIQLYRKAESNLTDCFGDIDIRKLTLKDGREFWRWLHEEKGFASNTCKQRMRYAQAFFGLAQEDGLIDCNPFKPRGISVSQSSARKEYISEEQISEVIDACPTLEWKLLFKLVRLIPTRIPSEIQDLTWNDVDWNENRILIHSPKTRCIGKHARWVPLFTSLKPQLQQMYQMRGSNDEPIFRTLSRHTNPGKVGRDILEGAGLPVWANFFNSLRATAQTDLMDQYGLRKACQWGGNSAATAMKTYALVQ